MTETAAPKFVKTYHDADEKAHEYDVLIDGELLGTVRAPARGLGESGWTGTLAGEWRATTRIATSRKDAVARMVERRAFLANR